MRVKLALIRREGARREINRASVFSERCDQKGSEEAFLLKQ
jgi:hypothetical protein